MQKLRVAVLMGGPSSEHDVSLETGKMVLRSLDPRKYAVLPVAVTREREWLISPEASPVVQLLEEEAARELRKKTDAVFIAMHGEYGEDGTVQGILAAQGVPYTGSGVLASALGMNKPLSSRLLADCGLTVPDFVTVGRYEFGSASERVLADAMRKLGLPLVAKPADRGSSVGVTIARDPSALLKGIAEALRHSREAMVQRYAAGKEVTCSVLEDETAPEGARALQPTEIVPKERAFFDYYSKYTAGASEEITPPRLPAPTIRAIQEIALTAHNVIGCSGMSRTDMIVGEDGAIFVLEVNTIPGMTPTSLLPQAAKAAGISFPELLDKMISSALKKTARK